MARDYRYGHKKKTVVARRSQESGSLLQQQAPTQATRSTPLTAAAKKKQTEAQAEPIEAIEAPTSAPEIPPELISEPQPANKQPRKSAKKAKAKPADTTSDKGKNTEAEANKAEDKAIPAPAEAQDSSPEDDEPVTKKRFFWLKATGLVVLLVSVTGWLIYAPFILAFALEMGWIDEETRTRWDSRESRQPQLALVEKVLPSPVAEPVSSPSSPEAVVEKQVDFTFYDELPKAVVQLAAQPLPVRTRAPVYLQLSAFSVAKDANEERARLAQKGYLSQVSAQANAQGKPSFVLRMGPYDDQRVINRLKVELQKLGVDAKEVTMTAVIKAQEAKVESKEKPVDKSVDKPVNAVAK